MSALGRDEYLSIEVVWCSCQYAFKRLVQAIRGWDSSNWPIRSAEVETRRLDGQRSVGCSTVEIVYKYNVEGSDYDGVGERSFFVWTSAVDFLNRMDVGQVIVVRVNPRNPRKSTIRIEDQVSR